MTNTKELKQAVESFELTSCIIHQQGSIKYIYEQYPDASKDVLPINSCTKSILSAAICIAMDKGIFPDPEVRVSEFFPELQSHRRKQRITIEHLLTMSAGFQWTEFGGSNSFPKMTRSSNWIEFVLNQPMAHEPGSKWVYNSGVSQMLAGILKQTTQMPISRFVEQQLFAPLGIEQYNWKSDPQGNHTGGYGMELAAVDMLKFGLLYLQRGEWKGREMIPAKLVDRSVIPAIAADSPPERGFYGWHWWVDAVNVPKKRTATENDTDTLHYYYARGYGGQFIFIAPTCNAVVVTTRKKQKKGFLPHDLFRQHLAPFLIQQ